MELQNFTKQEIPYDILESFGLTKKMIDDLPASVLQKLLTGRNTPPLPVEDYTQDNEKSHAITRIRLFRMEDGTVDVFFTPRMEMLEMQDLPNISEDEVKKGKIIRTDKGFAQYDETIEQIRFIPYGILLHNLENIQDITGISQKERDAVLKGNPVEITDGSYKGCTVGIDLSDENLIRLSKGGITEWKNEEAVNNLSKYNFGMFGCWVCEENSVMHYVTAQNYDLHPDIIEAFEARDNQQNKIK